MMNILIYEAFMDVKTTTTVVLELLYYPAPLGRGVSIQFIAGSTSLEIPNGRTISHYIKKNFQILHIFIFRFQLLTRVLLIFIFNNTLMHHTSISIINIITLYQI